MNFVRVTQLTAAGRGGGSLSRCVRVAALDARRLSRRALVEAGWAGAALARAAEVPGPAHCTPSRETKCTVSEFQDI